MTDKKLDDFMARLYHEQTEHLEASEELKQRINQRITQKGVFTMKKSNMKKWIAVAACVCLLAPTMLYAGGKITSYVSSTNPRDYSASEKWSDLAKFEKKSGVKADLPEKFTNGYQFKNMDISVFHGKDDTGNTISSTKQLTVSYQKAGANKIECNVNQTISGEETLEQQPIKEQEIKGVTVRYYNDTYKFVPEDYELTAEDQELQKQDDFYISYGTDAVEIKQYSYVKWEKDGVSYFLGGFDNELSGDELMQMAAEIIN